MPYTEARKHIEEADVLLFRAGGFPSIGWWITRYGGIHSHVGLAHWDRDRLYCIEQREFKGGRSVALKHQVEINPNKIDVYRPNKCVYIPEVYKNNGDFSVTWQKKIFGAARANDVTNIALELTGTEYGWKNIWEIVKCHAPFFRLLRKEKEDKDIDRAYVCSTLVTYSYRKAYLDPCPNLSDDRTTPADIAQSALFHYMFTIGEV